MGHWHWQGLIKKPGSSQVGNNPDTDLLCSNIQQRIPALTVPSIGGSLGSLTTTLQGIAGFTRDMNDRLTEKCDIYGANSWFLGAWSFAHFYIDQSQRKHMIYKVAEALINGKDIDGQDHSIENGVKKTFEKNLTFINKKAFESSTTPSLFQHSSLTGKTVGDLLDDPAFKVAGLYSKLEGRGDCERSLAQITTVPNQLDNQHETIVDIVNKLGAHINTWPACGNNSQGKGACAPSAGMQKTDLMVYYGVKAELEYKTQIFLPFPLKLQAKAIAKPFGGRIGPKQTSDRLLPSDHQASSFYEFDKFSAPNYSRYPGDEFGLRSKLVHHYWAKTVQSQPNNKHIQNYMKPRYFPMDRDPMARLDHDHATPPGINISARWWEIMAVAPDLFDVTYFTILPYYQYDYFPRLAKGILAGKPYLRGDLGTYCDTNPCNASSFAGTSLLTQVIGDSLGNNDVPSALSEIKTVSPYLFKRPAYKIKKLDLLLTGWNPPKKKYSTDTDYGQIRNNKTYFGECQIDGWVHSPDKLSLDRMDLNNRAQRDKTKGKIANGCIFGGRTGYSVKMVHPDLIQNKPSWW